MTGLLCSKIAYAMLTVLNPTMHFQVGNVGCIPVVEAVHSRKSQIDSIVSVAKIIDVKSAIPEQLR